MENFLKQIREREFKPSNFSVYGMIENDGYIIELEGMFGKRYGVDDFDYMVMELTEKEKNALLYRMSIITDKIKNLKEFIEVKIQEDRLKPKVRVYVNYDKRYMIIVKLKEFDLKSILEKENDQAVAQSSKC